MINRYRHKARMAAEIGLGWLAPLDFALPELSPLPGIVAGLAALSARGPTVRLSAGVGTNLGTKLCPIDPMHTRAITNRA